METSPIVASDCAVRVKCRTGVTQRIISSTALSISVGSGLEPAELFGVFGECLETAGDCAGRGVVACGGDDHVVAHELEVGQRVVVDGAIRDQRCEVLGGLVPALGGEFAEVAEVVLDRGDQAFRAASSKVLVARSEQLLGELEHSRIVVVGKAEDGEDDGERIPDGYVPAEVAGAVGLLESIDGDVGRAHRGVLGGGPGWRLGTSPR